MDQPKFANILLRPRVTEKATAVTANGVYVFEISEKADKKSVKQAVKTYFDVTPTKVRIVRNPAKKVIVRGKRGIKPGVKKAYVYLKKGEVINLS